MNILERFGQSREDESKVICRLRYANPGWCYDYALGYWHGMSDGANDTADSRHLTSGSDYPYPTAYRAAHKLYNGILLASRRFSRDACPIDGRAVWRCDRCGRVAGYCNDKPHHHRCVSKVKR